VEIYQGNKYVILSCVYADDLTPHHTWYIITRAIHHWDILFL
jgi:hypothetical protein